MVLKEKIDRFFDGIVFVQKKLTACMLLLMIVVVSIQIVTRLLSRFTPLAISMPWTEELATYTLIWMTFIGSIGVLVKGEHLTVDLFLLRYSAKQRRFARLIISGFILAFCVVLLIFGIRLCMSPIVLNGRTPALAISRLYIYISLPVAMFFNSLFSFYDVSIAIADLVTGGKFSSQEVTEA